MVALQARRGRGSIAWTIAALALVGVGLFVVAGWLGDAGAADHARFHALSAVISALVATGIVLRWPGAGIAAWAPTSGFAFYAVAQVIESVGALGFDTVRDTRNGLAIFDDFGLGVTALGMLAIVAGLFVPLILLVGIFAYRAVADSGPGFQCTLEHQAMGHC